MKQKIYDWEDTFKECRITYTSARKIAQDLADEFKIPCPKVIYTERKTAYFSFTKHCIGIPYAMLTRETAIHEMCHCILASVEEPHGPEFLTLLCKLLERVPPSHLKTVSDEELQFAVNVSRLNYLNELIQKRNTLNAQIERMTR